MDILISFVYNNDQSFKAIPVNYGLLHYVHKYCNNANGYDVSRINSTFNVNISDADINAATNNKKFYYIYNFHKYVTHHAYDSNIVDTPVPVVDSNHVRSHILHMLSVYHRMGGKFDEIYNAYINIVSEIFDVFYDVYFIDFRNAPGDDAQSAQYRGLFRIFDVKGNELVSSLIIKTWFKMEMHNSALWFMMHELFAIGANCLDQKSLKKLSQKMIIPSLCAAIVRSVLFGKNDEVKTLFSIILADDDNTLPDLESLMILEWMPFRHSKVISKSSLEISFQHTVSRAIMKIHLISLNDLSLYYANVTQRRFVRFILALSKTRMIVFTQEIPESGDYYILSNDRKSLSSKNVKEGKIFSELKKVLPDVIYKKYREGSKFRPDLSYIQTWKVFVSSYTRLYEPVFAYLCKAEFSDDKFYIRLLHAIQSSGIAKNSSKDIIKIIRLVYEPILAIMIEVDIL